MFYGATNKKPGFASYALALGLLLALAAAASPIARAQSYTPLKALNGSTGTYPAAGLLQDASGNLFGTTAYGGRHNQGTVFEINASGQLTVLYDFAGTADGGRPYSSLIFGTDGNLYGTTEFGGYMHCGGGGCGVVFRLTLSGQETVIHAFTGTPDGAYPLAGLVLDTATGTAYGTTSAGGFGTYVGLGTVFSINLSTGDEEVILACGTSGFYGTTPAGPLILDTLGNLYGTTSTTNGTGVGGTVFKLTPAGQVTTLCTFFNSPCAGNILYGGLAMDAAGNLYGTTYAGSNTNHLNYGLVYKISASGQFTVLHNFTGKQFDGGYPAAGLVLTPGGILYGTTSVGGNRQDGVIFQVSIATGAYSSLYSFRGATGPNPDGATPRAPLVIGASGTLYGTTTSGGNPNCSVKEFKTIGCGEVFQLIP